MSKRAEYTTGYACAKPDCTEPALMDVHCWLGYIHLCPGCAAEAIAYLYPEGLEPPVPCERQPGVWRHDDAA